MDFLRHVINPLDLCTKLCFLCFKKSESLYSISKKLFICDENNNTTSSIHNMMMYLFPLHEITFEDVCEDCSNLILSMYLAIKRHNAKKLVHNIILDELNNVLPQEIYITSQPLKLHFQMPTYKKQPRFKKRTLSNVNVNLNLKKLDSPMKRDKIKNNATICDICGKVCRTPNTLKAHLNCHRQKKCPYCMKILKTHSHFKLHVRNHEQLKKVRKKVEIFYYCNDCEYRSLNKCSLQAHVNKYHLGERPYVCEICRKGFYRKSNLTEHAITHNNLKIWTCEQCGDNFVNKKTLDEHLRLHSGEKPFQCDICKEKFVTSGRRSEHMKRKHSEKKEYCNLCGKKYSLKKDLNTHIKRIHEQRTDNAKIQLSQANYVFLHDNVLPVTSSI